MKTLTIIGSDIVSKVAKLLPKKDYKVNNEFISINPASFIKDKDGADIKMDIVNREAYREDARKEVFNNIKTSGSKYVLIDLLDCRLNFNTYEAGGYKFLATENNGLQGALKKFDFKVIENNCALELTEKQWFDILCEYKNKLCKYFPDKRIIVLDVRCANSYLSKNKRIYNLGATEYTAKMYNFFDKIYALMRLAAPEFIYIPGFDIYYCDEQYAGKVFSYSLQPQYYEYAAKAVDMVCCGEDIAKIIALRDEYNAVSLKQFRDYDPRAKKWTDCELNDFCGVYEDDFGNYIDTGDATVNITLRGQNNKVVIEKNVNAYKCRISLGNNNEVRISEGTVFRQDSLIKADNANCIEFGKNNNINSLWLVLKSRNKISLGDDNKFNEQNSVGIDSDCKFIIGNRNDIWKIEIHIFNYANLLVGDNDFFNKSILITCHSYTETVIKNNSIFASEVEIINGDGHSVFDVVSKKKVNDMRDGNNVIVINDHVWLCRRAMLITGAEIGQGCIVAAGAVCNKKFKLNNCLIAGVPAKIKKENVSWCRNNDTNDIESCAPYNNLTEKIEFGE